MARNVNGFGTTYYGATDRKEDGSFITTKWIILFFLPFLPLNSYRVKYLGEHTKLSEDITYYDIISKIPLHLKQVLRVYTILAIQFITVVLLIAIASIFSLFASKATIVIIVVLCIIALCLGPWKFYKAK